MHNPSLLGFSLLLLSCASPTLGAPAEPSSTPSSPSLGFSFNPTTFNPPEPAPLPGTPLSGSASAVTTSASDVIPTSAGSSFDASTSPAPTGIIAAAAVPSTSTVTPILKATEAVSPSLPDDHSTHSDSETNLEASSASESAKGDDQLATSSDLPVMKHSKASSSAHKKLASKLKAIMSPTSTVSLAASTSGPASSIRLDLVTSLPVSSSSIPSISSIPSLSASLSLSPQPTMSDFVEPVFSATRSIVEPTSNALGDPDPDIRSQTASDASLRARRHAIVAAFLILGTLGALGGGVLCFKCGVLPCCHSKDARRKPRESLKTAEEGLRTSPRVTSLEKSIIPGAPPQIAVDAPVPDMPILSRDSHTPSCSTCPDSLVGMKSGISGAASSSSWRVYATNEDGQYEDVTHVLASDTYSSVRSGASAYASAASSYGSPRHSADSGKSGTSGSGTQPASSVHSRTGSRASESGASMTAESYKSCESRYSTPSFERRCSREDGPPSQSASASSSLLHSPSSPASVLLLTPEQGPVGYVGLADAAGVVGPLETVAESEAEDMEMDSQWDVASAFAAPVQQKAQKGGVGRGISMAKADQAVGTVALGGRTCVLMRG